MTLVLVAVERNTNTVAGGNNDTRIMSRQTRSTKREVDADPGVSLTLIG